ncbi:MAG: hypothetical protein A2Y57_02930 [Candidatus Woykebacteria bacterium RBG_13_40_7b]|uniref:DUF4446 domain-containing protein n=1 Tax=Candidatus Woykebacteria bacterium RBG_13_40_7b TaxID=1802594 RepID=A0A1G1W567_9BACT|nr:MAG: hypothetical protein A2Y57_02930 [Candidatus Woykebacteria bacterium RBG_13_40_7b]
MGADFFNDQVSISLFVVGFLWLAGLTIISWQFIAIFKKLKGTTGKDLKNILEETLKEVETSSKNLKAVEARLEKIEKILPSVIQKVGLVRFNPYKEVGGDLSFALSLLDEKDSGVIISSLHSRESSRIYAKPVVGGEGGAYPLSEEEKEAIKIAKRVS